MKIILIFLLLFLAFGTSHAQSSREELIIEYFELVGIKKKFENIEEHFLTTLRSKANDSYSDIRFVLNKKGLEEADSTINKHINDLSKLGAKYFSWKAIKGDLVNFYQDMYTKEELIEINKFLSSHYGKRYIESFNKLDAEIPNFITQRHTAMKSELNIIASNMLTELKSIENNPEHKK